MLPSSYRLRSSSQFSVTIKEGAKKGSKTVVAHVFVPAAQPIATVGGPRVGLVVSKAVGNAVVRHGTSRQLRHAAWEVLQQLEIPACATIVLRALPSSASASYEELVNDVRSCIRRSLR